METNLFPLRRCSRDVKSKSAGPPSLTTALNTRWSDFPAYFAENPADREKRL